MHGRVKPQMQNYQSTEHLYLPSEQNDQLTTFQDPSQCWMYCGGRLMLERRAAAHKSTAVITSRNSCLEVIPADCWPGNGHNWHPTVEFPAVKQGNCYVLWNVKPRNISTDCELSWPPWYEETLCFTYQRYYRATILVDSLYQRNHSLPSRLHRLSSVNDFQ